MIESDETEQSNKILIFELKFCRKMKKIDDGSGELKSTKFCLHKSTDFPSSGSSLPRDQMKNFTTSESEIHPKIPKKRKIQTRFVLIS